MAHKFCFERQIEDFPPFYRDELEDKADLYKTFKDLQKSQISLHLLLRKKIDSLDDSALCDAIFDVITELKAGKTDIRSFVRNLTMKNPDAPLWRDIEEDFEDMQKILEPLKDEAKRYELTNL